MKIHTLSCFALCAAISLGPVLLGAPAQISYPAQIAQRQSQLNETERMLRETNEQVSTHECAMRDFAALHNAIENLAAAAERRPATPIKPDERLIINTAFQVLHSPHPQAAIDAARRTERTSVPLAGGNFEVRNGAELVRLYQILAQRMPASIEATKDLHLRRDRLTKDRERLVREMADVSREPAVAAQAILGRWRLATESNGSIVEAVQNPQTGAFVGILRHNGGLPFFQPNATVFVVEPLPGQGGIQFQGKEYGYNQGGLPTISDLTIEILGDAMNYRTRDETLAWKRVVDVSQWRAPLGRPPSPQPKPTPENGPTAGQPPADPRGRLLHHPEQQINLLGQRPIPPPAAQPGQPPPSPDAGFLPVIALYNAGVEAWNASLNLWNAGNRAGSKQKCDEASRHFSQVRQMSPSMLSGTQVSFREPLPNEPNPDWSKCGPFIVFSPVSPAQRTPLRRWQE